MSLQDFLKTIVEHEEEKASPPSKITGFMHTLSANLVSAKSLDHYLLRIAKEIPKFIHIDYIYIATLSDDGLRVYPDKIVKIIGRDSLLGKEFFSDYPDVNYEIDSAHPLAIVVKSNKPHEIHEIEPLFNEFTDKPYLADYLTDEIKPTAEIYPMNIKDEVLGCIAFVSKGSFNHEQKEILHVVTDHIAIAYNEERRHSLYKVEIENTADQNSSLSIQNKQLLSINKITSEIVSTLNVAEVAERVVRMIPAEFNNLRAVLAVTDKEQTELRAVEITRTELSKRVISLLGQDIHDLFIPLNEKAYQSNIGVRAVKEKKIFATNKVEEAFSPPAAPAVAKAIMKVLGGKCVVAVPVPIRGEIVGAVGFVLNDKFAEDLTDFDRDFMETIAFVIGIALDNANSYKSMQEAIERLDNATKQLEEKNELLRKQAEDLESKNTDLESARQKERDMLDIMGHELRTPLSILKMSVEILSKIAEKSPEEFNSEIFKKHELRLKDSLKREIRLLETMLTSTKLDADRMQLHLEKVDLDAIIEDALLAVKESAAAKGLKLVYEKPAEPYLVFADKVRLGEVIDNFVNNAVKYTPKGWVAVKVELAEDENSYQVHVVDTGYGIPAKDLAHLGEKFYRVQIDKEGERVARPGGTGLGLYVSFSLVKMMGGEVNVMSKEGKGSNFQLTVPVYKGQKEEYQGDGDVKNLFERMKLGK